MRGETAGPRQVARLALSIQNFCDSPAAAKTYAYHEFDEIDAVLFAQESIWHEVSDYDFPNYYLWLDRRNKSHAGPRHFPDYD